MSTSLTPNQRRVLRFIARTLVERQRFPVIREVSAHMGWSSPKAAHSYFQTLIRKGYMEYDGYGNYRVVGLAIDVRPTTDDRGQELRAILEEAS